MSPHACTKDQFVEQPAIGLFTALGWQTVSAMEETPATGGTLTANWEQFVQWKLMTRDDRPRPVSPGVMRRQPRKLPRLSRRIVCSDRAGAGGAYGTYTTYTTHTTYKSYKSYGSYGSYRFRCTVHARCLRQHRFSQES